MRYHSVDDEQTDVEIGVPVPDGVTGEGTIVAGQLPGGRVIVIVHLGGHDRLSEAYNRIEEWLTAHNGPEGAAWEVYEWIDLSTEPDPSRWPAPSEWRTEIVQPVR
ncbi:GyrI-like domain-containing protein [Nonomuraea sp. M3C6]|uniref:GyrI-like domain-containing protein n=1 Tax=Nonomuraea marmarensis TaxID=3351344 RepID=A0ABW7AT67_9ACTN